MSTLPISDLNAFAHKLPSGRPFVNFNSSFNQAFRGALAIFSEIFALTLASMRGEDIHPTRIGECVRGLLHLAVYIGTLEERHFEKHRDLVPQYAKETSDWLNIRGMFLNTFILLHEYGHLLHGDVQDADPIGVKLTAGDIASVKRRYRMEYSADRFAAEKLIAFFGQNPEGFSVEDFYTSIGVFFHLLDIMNVALCLPPSHSHPAPMRRWAQIKKLHGAFDVKRPNLPSEMAIVRVDMVFTVVKEVLPTALPAVFMSEPLA